MEESVEKDELALSRQRIAELEARLYGLETKWRSVLESMPQIVVSLDSAGKVIFANRHFLELTGWEFEEIYQKDWFQLCLPETVRDSVRAIFLQSLELGEVGPHSCHVNEIVTRRGKVRKVSWFNVITRETDGGKMEVTSIGFDLTAQEEANALAQASEERLTLALEAANYVVWDLDCATEEVYVSPQLYDLLGLDRGELAPTYEAWMGLVHPDDRPGFEASLREAIRDEAGFEREVRLLTGSGLMKWFLIRGKAVRSGTGSGSPRMAGTLLDIHDTKTAEEELRRAKMAADLANSALRVNMAHLRTLMETMPELVWVKDVNGVFLFCNHRFERLYGATEEEIVGRTDYDFVDRELADFFREHDRKAIAMGGPYTFEETVTYSDDGHVEELETIKTPLYGDNGKLVGVLGVARDITERKRIADRLKESEVRFKALHNASFGGIAIHDKGLILDTNLGLSEISGYSVDELIGMDGLLLIAESSRNKVMDNILAGYEKPYEVMGLRRNGEEYPLRLEARNIPYKGKAVRVVEFRDITERKRAEAELRDSEQRHRVIIENSPLGMIRFSEQGIILDCNDRFVEMMGSSREALLGFNTLRQSDPDMRRALGVAINGSPSSYEDYYTSVTGNKETFLHVQFNPVNPGQSPTEVIATLEDFSQRKQAQDALERAKEQAEAYSRSKTEFLTNMSHEIRTPLNGIMGMLQLIQASGTTPEQAEYTDAALQSSRRLMNLLSDILDLSRVEAGKLVMREVPFDLVETCEQVCDLFKLTATQTGVRLDCRLGDGVPREVFGDSVRLQQVLTNLLGNAFKFTTQGSVTLSAHRLADDRDGRYRLLFTVADTGMGIPDDKVDTLFDAFTQVSQGYTRQHQGAGLGLSICRNLVSLMGGSMAIDSEEGRGTTLYVSIPLGRGEPQERQMPEPETLPEQRIDGLSVLMAEDERVNSLVMQRVLEKEGHKVVSVENGRELLETLRAGTFDVVLMDIQMPVMDGVETSLAIRAGRAGKENVSIPIVAVTAYAMVGDREKFLEAGMDGYLVKPIEVDKLQRILAGVRRGGR
ncbi:MAG: PAS domain S-box protein [Pseudodesulfovibrio sp.]|uniref:PAS domain S-box protein n=1 Tax=Pseudodesulfovibrio sp. TaxID=2035812 RepID=UPI003D09B636